MLGDCDPRRRAPCAGGRSASARARSSVPRSLCAATVANGGILLGDTNCDGEVNRADLDTLLAALFGEPVDCAGLDVNGDGNISAADIIALMRVLPPASDRDADPDPHRADRDGTPAPAHRRTRRRPDRPDRQPSDARPAHRLRATPLPRTPTRRRRSPIVAAATDADHIGTPPTRTRTPTDDAARHRTATGTETATNTRTPTRTRP